MTKKLMSLLWAAGTLSLLVLGGSYFYNNYKETKILNNNDKNISLQSPEVLAVQSNGNVGDFNDSVKHINKTILLHKAENNQTKIVFVTKEENETKIVPRKEVYDFTKSIISQKGEYIEASKGGSVNAKKITLDKPKYKQISLKDMMNKVGVYAGDRVFVRIFKKEKVLELWMENSGAYHRVYTYPICAYSGRLGPKLKEGDKQSPEGFYSVTYNRLNPNSSYHLSFNLGFPNSYDRSRGRTGSYLMVHGKCASIGCYAMTDRKIEEIYGLIESALLNGQDSVAVHSFPFRMTKYNMNKYQNHKWYGFWKNLKEGYDLFEKNNIPPVVDVEDRRYVFIQE